MHVYVAYIYACRQLQAPCKTQGWGRCGVPYLAKKSRSRYKHASAFPHKEQQGIIKKNNGS